jgi:hypothetical protein
MQPRDLADIYWFLYEQPRSTWTHRLDVRAQSGRRRACFLSFECSAGAAALK